MSSPPATVADTDSHPSIPVSHPRTSSRSPTQSNFSPQPPISPPRPTINRTTNSTTSLSIPTPTSNNTPPSISAPNSQPKAPLTPPASSSRATRATVQVESAAPNSAAVLQEDVTSGTLRTPNVYINGLPPNFPEEQLYAMTREFGGVISVRTFTRHVSDRGMALFCLTALTAPPSVSSLFGVIQIHKIPGTPYAALATSASSSSVSTSSSGDSAETFKTRMEKLKDQGSTNLYIEGLPLSIDETTLSALVAPYVIKSSRFFQTRLSHPPRIIAFVRLENRSACEDVIERLHGRMVRGWNDPGSRISVRFADSAEQRELRRAERNGRDGGEQSPSRLTMAQAALLNLRGQQIQTRFRGGQHSVSAPSLSDMQRHIPPVHDRYSVSARGRDVPTGLPTHPLTAQYQQQAEVSVGFPSSRSVPAHLPSRGLPVAQADGAVFGSDIDLSLLSRTASSNGFTPLEHQLILQAQARAQVQAQMRVEVEARHEALYESQANGMLAAGLNGPRATSRLNLSTAMASKEFVPRGLLSRIQEAQSSDIYSLPSLSPIDVLSPRSEEEFHSTAQIHQQPFERQHHNPLPQSNSFNNDTRQNKTIYDDGEVKDHNTHLASSLDYVFNDHAEEGRVQNHQALHTRSTTLPPHFMLGGNGVNSTNKLSSILSPNLNSLSNMRNSNTTAQALASRLNAALPTICTVSKSGSGTHSTSTSSDTISSSISSNSNISGSSSSTTCTSTSSSSVHSSADSPLLVPSPALTYNSSSSSSSRTPSTLSPTTPFFGSFASAGDGFAGTAAETYGKAGEHVHEAKAQGHQGIPGTESFVGTVRADGALAWWSRFARSPPRTTPGVGPSLHSIVDLRLFRAPL
ncbi:hypothetical protein EW146_g1221 [Bondarzewia mesenterica]|uniref:RRM domain-containing protein n=1 Tax=Bondarzewia mesenterica TaxID=1095465 RepID=A0A4S4M6S8_9AGAM|nr:hypothetical protein EW146_g1221 [Bondarzewia mesenterica]